MFFVHPGYEKTATTTLQTNVFKDHPELVSIGRPHTDLTRELCKELKKPEGFYDKETVTNILSRVIPEDKGGRNVILSDETFTKNSHQIPVIARRMKDLFPDAHVLLTIRNQVDMIKSYYVKHGRVLQSVPKPYIHRHIKFGNWLEFSFDTWEESFLGRIDYDVWVRVFEEIFGPEKIHIFVYEEFESNFKEFLGKMSHVLGIDEKQTIRLYRGEKHNPRDSARLVRYVALRQTVAPNVPLKSILPGGETLQRLWLGFLEKGEKLDVTISSEWAKKLYSRYSEGNRRLASCYDLPLEQYGYFM